MDYSYAFFSERVPVVNNGVGHPARANGLVKTGFRPSDDLAMMPFHIPDNALLCVELRGLAKLLQKENQRPDLVQQARKIADRIEKAIWEHGVFEMDGFGKIFAYEVDGFGGRVFVRYLALFFQMRAPLVDTLALHLLRWMTRTSRASCRCPSSVSLVSLT